MIRITAIDLVADYYDHWRHDGYQIAIGANGRLTWDDAEYLKNGKVRLWRLISGGKYQKKTLEPNHLITLKKEN